MDAWLLRADRHFYRGRSNKPCPHCPSYGSAPCLTQSAESAIRPLWWAFVRAWFVLLRLRRPEQSGADFVRREPPYREA